MAGERFFQGTYYDNLGISLSSGTLTIQGANGRDLSSSNPAVIVLPSKVNPGQFTRYNITANQSFNDASSAGGSDITGNLFGLTTGVSVGTSTIPFFIYAVGNDNEDTIQFMISRVPNFNIAPAAASIGAPDDPAADTQVSLWSLSNIDETLYDGNPCLNVGSLRLRMDASDDWTVQAIDNTDGFGRYNHGPHNVPLGQFGANSGTWTIANGGTAPVFNSLRANAYWFTDIRQGTFQCVFDMSGDGGTDGSGAVEAQIIMPFIVESSITASVVYFQGSCAVANSSYNEINMVNMITSSNYFQIKRMTASQQIQWGDFGNGDRTIRGTYSGRIKNI